MSRPISKTGISNRALEMIMRDVLDGMEDLSLQLGYRSGIDNTKINLLLDSRLQTGNLIYFSPELRNIA